MKGQRAILCGLIFLAVPPWKASEGQAQAPAPVSQQEIDALRREIQEEIGSSLELLGSASGESGDLNNWLGTRSYGARLTIKRAEGRRFHVTALRSEYATRESVLEETGTSVVMGVAGKGSLRWEYEIELGGRHFSTDNTQLEGGATARLKASPKAVLSVSATRSGVFESLLSATGMQPVTGPFGGDRVGPVLENRLLLAASYRLPLRIDVFGDAGVGNRGGRNVGDNAFRRALAGLGYAAIAAEATAPVSLLRLSASLFYLDFDDDRLGYGGSSLLDAAGRPVPPERLGSDRLPTEPTPTSPGVGGYFSPDGFRSVVGRVDVRGRLGASFEYEAEAFLGTQRYGGLDGRRAAGIAARCVIRLGDRVSLPVRASWDDYGPFTQHLAQVGLRVRF